MTATAIQIAVENALRDRQWSDVGYLVSQMVEEQDVIDRIRLFDREGVPVYVSNPLKIADAVSVAVLGRVIASGASEELYERPSRAGREPGSASRSAGISLARTAMTSESRATRVPARHSRCGCPSRQTHEAAEAEGVWLAATNVAGSRQLVGRWPGPSRGTIVSPGDCGMGRPADRLALCLPTESPMKDASATHESPILPPGGDRRTDLTLLVVDDDAEWRDALKQWLEREGFRAIMLARGDWVVHAVDLHRPDVVVLDVNLPGANGLEVLGAVERRWPALPVVIMTAFGGPTVGAEARRLGAAAYIEKPFRMATLVDAIRRAAGSTGSDPRRAQA